MDKDFFYDILNVLGERSKSRVGRPGRRAGNSRRGAGLPRARVGGRRKAGQGHQLLCCLALSRDGLCSVWDKPVNQGFLKKYYLY